LSSSLHKGISDEAIAIQLTAQGHRSPMRQFVLPSTVKIVRLKHAIMPQRNQSHPRRIDGYLIVPQLAKTLDISVHYIYDRIHNGTIEDSALRWKNGIASEIPFSINIRWA
jgi:hypothetical protein